MGSTKALQSLHQPRSEAKCCLSSFLSSGLMRNTEALLQLDNPSGPVLGRLLLKIIFKFTQFLPEFFNVFGSSLTHPRSDGLIFEVVNHLVTQSIEFIFIGLQRFIGSLDMMA